MIGDAVGIPGQRELGIPAPDDVERYVQSVGTQQFMRAQKDMEPLSFVGPLTDKQDPATGRDGRWDARMKEISVDAV